MVCALNLLIAIDIGIYSYGSPIFTNFYGSRVAQDAYRAAGLVLRDRLLESLNDTNAYYREMDVKRRGNNVRGEKPMVYLVTCLLKQQKDVFHQ